MNRKALHLALIGALLLVAPALYANDHHGCTLRKLSGDWGYTTNGTRVGVGPVAGAGSYSADRDGNILDGKQTVSFNGLIADETFSGTYTVNDDCTGSAVVVVASPVAPRTSHLNIVWINDGDDVRMVFTDAGTVLTVDGKRIH